MQSRREKLTGWALFPSIETDVYRLERMRELAELSHHDTVLARGLGRSYGDAALSKGAVLLTERLDRFISFDQTNGVLRCESGTSLAKILEFCVPRGFMPLVLPGTRFVTVGGAIACDIHGKNHHQVGSFAACVIEFDLMTASGEMLTCSRSSNADVFWATMGGMGLTGIITDVTLRLVRVPSPHVRVRYAAADDLDDMFDRTEADDQKQAYSMAWLDGLARARDRGRGVLMTADHAAPEAGTRLPVDSEWVVPKWWSARVLTLTGARLFNARYYATHRSKREASEDYRSFFFKLDRLGGWNRLYGRGFTQYQFVVPEAAARRMVKLALDKLAGWRPYLVVLKRMGPAAPEQMLSFPTAGYTLSVDMPLQNAGLFAVLDELDSEVADSGGRIYLAKDARARADHFARMYASGLDRWRAVKAAVDPNNRFRSLLGDRLELRP